MPKLLTQQTLFDLNILKYYTNLKINILNDLLNFNVKILLVLKYKKIMYKTKKKIKHLARISI